MYIVQELQTNGETTSVLNLKETTDENEALSTMYMALASAAISTVEVHTVMIVNERGHLSRSETFDHVNGTHDFTIM